MTIVTHFAHARYVAIALRVSGGVKSLVKCCLNGVGLMSLTRSCATCDSLSLSPALVTSRQHHSASSLATPALGGGGANDALCV